MVKDKETKEKSIEVLKENILLVASKLDELTNKVNEIVAVLSENNLTRKIAVDYIYNEEETEESEEEKEDSEEDEDEEEEVDEDDEEELVEVEEPEEEEVKPTKSKKK